MIEEDDQKLVVRRVLRNGRRRYDAASKERLVAACLEPGVSVSRLALEHGINANLLRKWIKKHQETHAVPSSSPSAFVPLQIAGARDRALSRPSSAFALDLPAARGEVRRPETGGMAPLCSPAKVSASLPNGVKLTVECGDVQAVTAIIGALGHVQTGR